MRTIVLISLAFLTSMFCRAEDAFGTWKMNLARSQFSDNSHYPRAVTLRIESHEKGELFTYQKITSKGQIVTISTVLHLDGKERGAQLNLCPESSGTKSSRRLDRRTVEVLHKCVSGEWIRFVRRLGPRPTELVLEFTERQSDGRVLVQRFVMEKQ